MNRLDYIDAVRLTSRSEVRRLDYHSARYAGLSRVSFNYSLHLVEASQRNRPDLVALKVYNDSTLWFVLYQYNGILDPIVETVPGLQLKVPDFRQLKGYLDALNAKVASSETSQVVEL